MFEHRELRLVPVPPHFCYVCVGCAFSRDTRLCRAWAVLNLPFTYLCASCAGKEKKHEKDSEVVA
jgi:hypothetical protein